MSSAPMTIWTLLDKYLPTILPILTLCLGYFLHYVVSVKITDRMKRRELYIKLCGLRSISKSIIDDTLENIINFYHTEAHLDLYIGTEHEDVKAVLKESTLQWNERCIDSIREQNRFRRQLNEALQMIPLLFSKSKRLMPYINGILEFEEPEINRPSRFPSEHPREDAKKIFDEWATEKCEECRQAATRYEELFDNLLRQMKPMFK